jgi:hypothetical protein
VDVGEGDPAGLVVGDVDTDDTRHTSLPLTLLVALVGADHAHDALAPDDLAVLTHSFDRCSDLHD